MVTNNVRVARPLCFHLKLAINVFLSQTAAPLPTVTEVSQREIPVCPAVSSVRICLEFVVAAAM